MAGKLGKLPATPDKPRLKLAPLLRSEIQLPRIPPNANYAIGMDGLWEMRGNDNYGDCVAVTAANSRAMTTLVLTGKVDYPDDAATLEFYKTQNPDFPTQDDGMNMQTACEDLVKIGIGGVKAIAFAEVDHKNIGEIEAAIAIFGGVMLGCEVQQAQMSQFDTARPWDYVQNSPIEGGHAIWTPGYLPLLPVTWAKQIHTTALWLSKLVDEMWVVIWPEHLENNTFLQGMDMAALASAYTAITGRPFPVAPAPVPPAPAPEHLAEDMALAKVAYRYLRSGPNTKNYMGIALRQWLNAKGL